MKKILVNSPQRSGSTYLHALIKECLPVSGILYLEKIDMGWDSTQKIELWKTSHENQIQVTMLRDPYDSVVSHLERFVNKNITEENPNLWPMNDINFVKTANVIIKSLEKYYRAINEYSDENHIICNFNIFNNESEHMMINKIFEKAKVELITKEKFDLAKSTALIETKNAPSKIRHYPNEDNESYNKTKDKLKELKQYISFNLINKAYNKALEKTLI